MAQSQATNMAYKSATNSYDINTSAADWVVKTTASGVTVGTETIDPKRGNKHTIQGGRHGRCHRDSGTLSRLHRGSHPSAMGTSPAVLHGR